jgi:hypothetical protein
VVWGLDRRFLGWNSKIIKYADNDMHCSAVSRDIRKKITGKGKSNDKYRDPSLRSG